MTSQELNTMTFDISDKVRHFRTFSKLFNDAVMHNVNLETQLEKLPALDDIAALACMLADQADDAVDKLISHLPSSGEGITP